MQANPPSKNSQESDIIKENGCPSRKTPPQHFFRQRLKSPAEIRVMVCQNILWPFFNPGPVGLGLDLEKRSHFWLLAEKAKEENPSGRNEDDAVV